MIKNKVEIQRNLFIFFTSNYKKKEFFAMKIFQLSL